MQSNIWEKIEAYLADKGIGYTSTGANMHEIDEAEKKIGVQFGNAYKKLLLQYGVLGIEDTDIHGLRFLPLMDKNTWSVVDKTFFYKHEQKWPDIENWYIISDDGRGNPIGIDPEGRVWLSDHDAGFEKVKLADNFEEFLHKLLTDTLYE